MSCEKLEKIQGIYVIVDNSLCPQRSHLEITERALEGGAKIIQLRAKQLLKREVYRIARVMARLCQRHQAIFIVNDYLDIALEVGADGVHLGADDLPVQEAKKQAPQLIIGRSTHRLKEAIEAEKAGADYIAFGAIFPTESKGRAVPAQGVEKLREVCQKVKKPVVAIGGIKRENLAEVKKAGASAVAMISEIVLAEDIKERVRELVQLWEAS